MGGCVSQPRPDPQRSRHSARSPRSNLRLRRVRASSPTLSSPRTAKSLKKPTPSPLQRPRDAAKGNNSSAPTTQATLLPAAAARSRPLHHRRRSKAGARQSVETVDGHSPSSSSSSSSTERNWELTPSTVYEIHAEDLTVEARSAETALSTRQEQVSADDRIHNVPATPVLEYERLPAVKARTRRRRAGTRNVSLPLEGRNQADADLRQADGFSSDRYNLDLTSPLISDSDSHALRDGHSGNSRLAAPPGNVAGAAVPWREPPLPPPAAATPAVAAGQRRDSAAYTTGPAVVSVLPDAGGVPAPQRLPAQPQPAVHTVASPILLPPAAVPRPVAKTGQRTQLQLRPRTVPPANQASLSQSVAGPAEQLAFLPLPPVPGKPPSAAAVGRTGAEGAVSLYGSPSRSRAASITPPLPSERPGTPMQRGTTSTVESLACSYVYVNSLPSSPASHLIVSAGQSRHGSRCGSCMSVGSVVHSEAAEVDPFIMDFVNAMALSDEYGPRSPVAPAAATSTNPLMTFTPLVNVGARQPAARVRSPSRGAVQPLSLQLNGNDSRIEDAHNASTVLNEQGKRQAASLLLPLSPPFHPGVSGAAQLSPMNSPAGTMPLPYARNLRPTQWQYASILHKKIEVKAQERHAEKQQQQQQRRLLSDMTAYSMLGRPPPAVYGKQLPTSRGTEGESTGAEAVEVDEDPFGYSCYSYQSPALGAPLSPQTLAGRDAMSRCSATSLFRITSPHRPRHSDGPAGHGTAACGHPTQEGGNGNSPQRLPFSSDPTRHGHGPADEHEMVRMASLNSLEASMYTDDGFPLLDPHVSDFYRDLDCSLSGMSVTADNSSIAGVTRDDATYTADGTSLAATTTTTGANGRVMLQGTGFNLSTPPRPPSQPLDGDRSGTHPAQSRRVFTAHSEKIKSGGTTRDPSAAMRMMASCSPAPSRRWVGTAAPLADRRLQLLRDQRRRLLREQRRHTLQLKQAEAQIPVPVMVVPRNATQIVSTEQQQQQHQHQEGEESASHEGSHHQPLLIADADERTKGSLTPELVSPAVTYAVAPSAVPTAPSSPTTRAMLAVQFFSEMHVPLNVPHKGTTALGDPQPDIKYGPFVATDKSRTIDFEKALGFGLADVRVVDSPDWDALPVPPPNIDSEEL